MRNMKPFSELFIQCLKSEGSVHKTIFICDTSCKVQGVLRLSSGLIIHQEFTPRTHSVVCYSERIQIKASQRTRCRERSSEPGVSLSSPHGVTDSVTFMVMRCDNLRGVLPTRDAQLSLGFQEFSWGPVAPSSPAPLRKS